MKRIYKTKENHHLWQGGKPHCMICGKQLTHYSSKKCKICQLLTMPKGKSHPNYKDGFYSDTKNKCIVCNKEISATTKRCQSCAKLGNLNPMKGKMNGDLNPNWHGGISQEGYPFEFDEQLKEQIRKRDNYECQNCSMTEEEHLIVLGRVLCIHHIDYDKENCKKDNLITLCHQCNVRANVNRDYWQKVFTKEKICV
jgi:hypothetical protein